MPNNKVITPENKKVLRAEDYNNMTLEEQHKLIDDIINGIKMDLFGKY